MLARQRLQNYSQLNNPSELSVVPVELWGERWKKKLNCWRWKLFVRVWHNKKRFIIVDIHKKSSFVYDENLDFNFVILFINSFNVDIFLYRYQDDDLTCWYSFFPFFSSCIKYGFEWYKILAFCDSFCFCLFTCSNNYEMIYLKACRTKPRRWIRNEVDRKRNEETEGQWKA